MKTSIIALIGRNYQLHKFPSNHEKRNKFQFTNISYMIGEALLFIMLALFIGLSQVAGVGGGPIVNISLMTSLGYDAKLSISVTYVFLIGGSLASIYKNMVKKSTSRKDPTVDLNLLLVSIPSMSSGSLFGGIIRNFLSQAIITCLFITLFVYLLIDLRSTIKKQSTQAISQLIELVNIKPLIQNKKNPVILDQNLQIDDSNKNYLVLKVFLSFYIFTVGICLLRGGLRYDSIFGISPCGIVGMLIVLLHFAVAVFISTQIAAYIISSKQSNTLVNQSNIWHFIGGGFCAGLLGATLAIGGALILIPVWLNCGISKQTATSTTGTLILQGALVAFTIAYLNNNYESVSIIVLVFYLILSIIGSALVKDGISQLQTKYRIKNFVLKLLFVLVALSFLVLVPYQWFKFRDNPAKFVSFGQFC